MVPCSRPLATLLALAAGVSLLSSCSGGASVADPLAPFREQALAWTPCDPTIVPEGFRADLASVSTRATCAFMRVPVDYANPGSGEILVALLRVGAEDASGRRGAILLNPGGPGDDGLFMAPAFGALWQATNPADPVGAIYKELSRRYDLVGFSPRGTGASTQLDCTSPEQLSFVANPSADRSPANVSAMLRNGRIQAAGCRKSPLTPFVNTDATARDMDLIRAVLRDPKIGYLGASYGTWLGAWWASLFPDRVDRLLLSGVVDLTTGLSNIFPLQAMGQQRVWDEVMVPWAALHPDTYLLGSTTAEVRAVYPALRQEIRQAVNVILTGGMGNERSRDRLLHALLAARITDGIIDQLPPPQDPFDAYGRVEAAIAFVPDDGRRTAVRELARQLVGSYFEIVAQVSGLAVLSGSGATQWAVICNDVPFGYDLAAWVGLQDRLAALYPLQGGLITGSPCLYWGPPTVTRPPLQAASLAGPILFTQTELDPQTPVEGARASLAAMPTASMVQVDGGWNHGVTVPSGNPCVDVPVGRYLLHGTPPPLRETHCPHAVSVTSPGLFLDTARAEAIRTRLAEAIGPAR
ncbi:MAG: alpha/beta fold hydrolase [Deltaproteobacteria bacterium]